MVELLPDGTWQPVEDARPSVASKQLHGVAPGDDDDVQILADTDTRDGAHKRRPATVPVSVLYELHSKLSRVFQELNSLGYKRLKGVAYSLVDMNAYIKEQITHANENSRLLQETDECKRPQNAVEDKIHQFKQPQATEKELSPLVTNNDNSLSDDPMDAEKEERHVEEQVDGGKCTKCFTNFFLGQCMVAAAPRLNTKSKSGYIFFSAEMRKRIMNENPEAGFGEVSRIVGVEWKKLMEEQKRRYEVRAEYIAGERAKAELLTPPSK
ncbi:polybromodomain proteinidentical, partial [Aphelenchoides avenae]